MPVLWEILTSSTEPKRTNPSVEVKPVVTKKLVAGKEDNTVTSEKPSNDTDHVVAFITRKGKFALAKPQPTPSASRKRELPVVAAGNGRGGVCRRDRRGILSLQSKSSTCRWGLIHKEC